jgi:DNA-binding XRE family transcriptional regulator
MLGVSRQTVSDWFAGRTVPTLSTGLKIQAFLQASDGAQVTLFFFWRVSAAASSLPRRAGQVIERRQARE